MLKALRIFAILEGISYLLFAVTMPLKYMYSITEPNYWVGLAHGILFIVYNVLVLVCAYRLKWNFRTVALSLLASLVPAGTFIADASIFKPAAQQ